MTIRHLRIFAAVVDCGTMHAAAQKLYISQPTITQAIKELEEHYGCLLFERYGRRLTITPAGQELLGYARELLSGYERMERSMQEQAGHRLLRVGATLILAEQLLVPMIRAFESRYPEIRVEVLVDNSSVLESRLLSGELDTALLDAAGRSGEIRTDPFLRDHLVVAAAPFHPLAALPRPVTARQLAECDFIMREEGSMPRRRLAAFLGKYGLTPRIKWSCTNLHTVVQAVEAGMGVSLLSSVLVQEEMTSGALREIPVEGLSVTREISLAVRRGRSEYGPLEQFLEFCPAWIRRTLHRPAEEPGSDA